MADNKVSLSSVRPGQTVKVSVINGGLSLNRRLADMGLVPGTSVRVLRGHGMGPTLVELRGSQLVLGFGVAKKIMVEEAGG